MKTLTIILFGLIMLAGMAVCYRTGYTSGEYHAKKSLHDREMRVRSKTYREPYVIYGPGFTEAHKNDSLTVKWK